MLKQTVDILRSKPIKIQFRWFLGGVTYFWRPYGWGCVLARPSLVGRRPRPAASARRPSRHSTRPCAAPSVGQHPWHSRARRQRLEPLWWRQRYQETPPESEEQFASLCHPGTVNVFIVTAVVIADIEQRIHSSTLCCVMHSNVVYRIFNIKQILFQNVRFQNGYDYFSKEF